MASKEKAAKRAAQYAQDRARAGLKPVAQVAAMPAQVGTYQERTVKVATREAEALRFMPQEYITRPEYCGSPRLDAGRIVTSVTKYDNGSERVSVVWDADDASWETVNKAFWLGTIDGSVQKGADGIYGPYPRHLLVGNPISYAVAVASGCRDVAELSASALNIDAPAVRLQISAIGIDEAQVVKVWLAARTLASSVAALARVAKRAERPDASSATRDAFTAASAVVETDRTALDNAWYALHPSQYPQAHDAPIGPEQPASETTEQPQEQQPAQPIVLGEIVAAIMATHPDAQPVTTEQPARKNGTKK